MEPINDNGQDPRIKQDELYTMPKSRRHRLLPMVIITFVAGMLFMGLLIAVLGGTLFARAPRRHMRATHVQAVEISEVINEIAQYRVYLLNENVPSGQLQRIRGSGPLIPAEGIRRLNVEWSNGNIDVVIHEEPEIWINGQNAPSYEFSEDGQVLSIQNRHSNVQIFIPYNIYHKASLEELHINNRHGNIAVIGLEHTNALLAEILHIHNQNGNISLSDLAISDSLSLETRHANINLRNVFSNPLNTRLYTRNGNINVTE